MRRARISGSHADAGIGTPASCSITVATPSMPRRFESRYCQSGRNRANAEVPTGSTCARSAARDRLRRIRSTSASHHCSESVASEVNSPRTSWPRAAIAESVSAATRTPRPKRCAASPVVNGPCVRAYRLSSSPNGSVAASVNAAGTPGGTGTPSASRKRATSSTAAHQLRCP
ncbi:Uncharacterised protein [Mycobacteroides abscessus subsp. massiliense]|nr:Uncharacterised protein [Mycobacteroides abscessus subsp. massiliense]